jgi:hypothetical protein
MQALSITQDSIAWYKAYEALDNRDQQAAFLLDTLRHPITREDFDQTDLESVIFDFVGHVFDREKRFEEALDFLRQFEQLQPDLYAHSFYGFANKLFNYYCFLGQAEKAESVIRFFEENPNTDIDLFMEAQRAVWYWLKQDWGVQLAAKTYEAVREHTGYLANPEIEMALAEFASSLQAVYAAWQRTGTFDVDAAKALAADYDLAPSEATWARYQASITTPLDPDAADRFASEKRADLREELKMRFLVWMNNRGFPFYSAWLIWDRLIEYWDETHPKAVAANDYFSLNKKSFDRYLAGKKNLIVPLTEEIGATLWGATFVYDFLGEQNLIPALTLENAREAIAMLKQDFFFGLSLSGWSAAFVVKAWPKADSVSQADAEAEANQFHDIFVKPAPPADQLTEAVNSFFDDISTDSGDKPRSLYERVFGNNPPKISKKKRKKKKR